MTTFDDLSRYCLTYMASDATAGPDIKRIVLAAYRNMANCHPWNYYKRYRRLNTVRFQNTGTIEYDQTGGTSERLLTLTGSTWPSWAPNGFVRINTVMYDVDRVLTSTTLMLSEGSNPGADIAAGTAYEIMQDAYLLPDDFQSIMHIEWSNQLMCPTYLDPTEFASQVGLNTGPGQPTYYTILGDRRGRGKRVLRFWPAPDAVYQSNLFYNTRGRAMAIEDVHAGTATATLNSTTITGSGTAFTEAMVGSVIRLYSDALQLPTGLDDLYPYSLERIITGWVSATQLEVDSIALETLTGVNYKISDPADIADGSMLNLLYREIDKQARLHKRIKWTQEEMSEYNMAQMLAFEADSTYAGPRTAGGGSIRPRQFTDYPINVS